MSEKKFNKKVLASNKKAFSDYQILDKIEAGICLNGYEVKSLRSSRAGLSDNLVRFIKGEAFIENMFIGPYENISTHILDYNAKRKRKLLLHKQEINKLSQKVKEKGLTLIALEVYLCQKGLVKILLGLAKGKHSYDKREDLKRKDLNREIARQTNIRHYRG
ncbi:MAG: SsrA-binding protein SmpB [Elusimicrobiota bacterium]|jgi:SsrA-binding protein|nr:SsrA-binding protein SmpB [Elusimicrobiota bacterium]